METKSHEPESAPLTPSEEGEERSIGDSVILDALDALAEPSDSEMRQVIAEEEGRWARGEVSAEEIAMLEQHRERFMKSFSIRPLRRYDACFRSRSRKK